MKTRWVSEIVVWKKILHFLDFFRGFQQIKFLRVNKFFMVE